MRVLNATRSRLSFIDDRGDTITINPGQLSHTFVGTRNAVISAIGLGSETEIGIICTSPYDVDIANDVKVASPYIHFTEEEAIAKLIKKDVDYTRKPTRYEIENLELDKANYQIEQYKKEIEELKLKCENKSQDEEAELTKLKEVTDKITELTGYREKFEDLQKQVKKNYVQKSEYDKVFIKIKEIETENKKLKEGLEKTLTQIEEMKNDFNAACQKFKITKKDDEWVQVK